MSNENSGNPSGSEVSGLLVQGFKAAKENRRDEAYNIFCDVVRRDPNNELGWLYRAATTDDLSEAYVCLQRVLSINPSNEKAQRGIERIQARLNSDEAEETPAATQSPSSQPPRSNPPAQFGEAEVVSGLRPANPAPPPPPATTGIYDAYASNNNDNQATARYPYEETGASAAGAFFNRPSASQLPDVPATQPPPYRPDPQARLPWETDEADSGQNNNYNDYSPNERPVSDYNYNQNEAPSYNDNSELVDEPMAVSSNGRDRTRNRLKSGRGNENPRIGGPGPNTGRQRIVGARSRGRSLFGTGGEATGLDQTGRDEARRRQRPLLLIGVLLFIVAIIVLLLLWPKFFSNTSDSQQAANATANAGTGVDTSGATSAADPPTPFSTTGGTPGGAVSVPVVGQTTSATRPTTVAAGQPTPAPNGGQVNPPPPANTTQAAPPPAGTTQPAPPPANTQAAPPGAAPRAAVYVVKGGDNLTRIAQQNNTSIEAIRAANRAISNDRIFGGNRLVMPVGRPDYRGKGGAILAKGETLQTLADRFKVSVDDIAKFNSLANPADAKEGDAILIP